MSAHNLPRPEYPRPQFVRSEWLCLNGTWEFAFDDTDHGLSEGWCDGRQLEAEIVVPFPHQCERSGINDKGVHPVVWYARSFTVPDEWRGRDVLLHFGAVDYRTTVWVNGQEVGHNRGGHVPFAFDISPYLTEENRLVLRVEDSQDPRQPRGKQSSTGLPHGIDYYCTTGIWQSVWLEPVPPRRIEDVVVIPQLDPDALELTVYLHAPSTEWHVEAEVREGERVVARAAVETPYAVAQLRLEIPQARRWSPDDPHLYDVHLRLRCEGELLDEVQTYAGLRRVELRGGRMLLNGEPTYLVSVLDQGYWPESYLAPPSDEALRRDVELIKAFGFNCARKHQKIEDPRWLYWCDRLGLMVWAEMPNGRAWSTEAEERLLAEWERAVCRDLNHPCIVAWVPVNESMGFPDLREGHPGQYSFLERMVTATRRLDATRPVIDNDGWEHTDVADIIAVHDYSHSSERLKEHWRSALDGGPMPARIWSGSRTIFARDCRYHGQPIMLTEVGGFLLQPELPRESWDRMYNIYASIASSDELLGKYRDLMEGIRELPFVSGFCYTQLTDIEQEINGLLTYDRRLKVDPERIAAIHRELFDGQAQEVIRIRCAEPREGCE
ncbi:MAG: glycoside hydrolase family 2 protein [Armatimonadota bacterium]